MHAARNPAERCIAASPERFPENSRKTYLARHFERPG